MNVAGTGSVAHTILSIDVLTARREAASARQLDQFFTPPDVAQTCVQLMARHIDHNDEFVRNTTARAFAVVASSLGIASMLPFLKPVCRRKKSWFTRHTGIKIVQQIAILMGCAVLPHLRSLVEIIEHGLKDE